MIPDAWPQIQAENQFNDPPDPGEQFFMVNISLTYMGTGSDKAFIVEVGVSMVGASNVAYSAGLEHWCGVIPNELDAFADVFTGGTVTGHICREVTNADAGTLVLYYSELGSSRQVFFRLR